MRLTGALGCEWVAHFKRDRPFLAILSLATILAGCKGSQIDDGFVGGITSSATQSTLTLSNATVLVGQSISVQLSIKDQNGNLFYVPNNPPQVSFSLATTGTSAGTFGTLQDLQTGIFTATFTGVTSGTATAITATVNGAKINASPSVQVTSNLSAFTLNIPFTSGTSSSYSISNTSSVSLMSTGGAHLTAADQSDTSSNTVGTSGGFQNGSLNGAQWDSTNNILRLNASTNNAELDASWTPQWSSLVGYWTLDSSFGATVGPSLTATGAGASIAAASVKVGSGYGAFNGTAGAAATAASTFGFPNTTFTVSVWLNTTSTGGNNYFISNGGIGQGWAIRVAVNQICIMLKNYSNSQITLGTSPTVNDGNWHHIVAVITTNTTTEASNNAAVYIDGQSTTVSQSLPGTGAYGDPTNTSAMGIGARAFPGGSDFFTGSLDDAAIWSTGLTAAQVQTIYARQSAKYSGQITSRVLDAYSSQSWTTFSTSTTLPFYKELPSSTASESTASYSSTGGSLTNGLVGLWHMNETTGTIAYDSSGKTGGNGTIVSTPTLGVTAPFSTGYNFPDNQTKYVSLPASSTLDSATNSSFTFQAWYYPTAYPAGTDTTNYQDAAAFVVGRQGYHMGLNQYPSGKFAFTVYDSSNTTHIALATTASKLNQWHHLVGTVTVGTTSSTVSLYVDGVPVASTTFASTTLKSYSGITYKIGTAANAVSWSCPAIGTIDEVAIWSRALVQSEVVELYRRGANRIKYQVRSCSASDCSDQQALTTSGYGWKGPDNTQLSYFSELYNTTSNILGGSVSTGAPTMTFGNFGSLSVAGNRYVQYRAILESDDANSLCTYNLASAACSPELQSASFGPNHYDTNAPSIINTASIGSSYQTLDANGFTETLGTNSCSAGTAYALSSDGTNFYYWNGSAWASSTGYATASTAAVIKANIGTFPQSAAGTGILQIKTYLESTGTSPCEVTSLQITGKKL